MGPTGLDQPAGTGEHGPGAVGPPPTVPSQVDVVSRTAGRGRGRAARLARPDADTEEGLPGAVGGLSLESDAGAARGSVVRSGAVPQQSAPPAQPSPRRNQDEPIPRGARQISLQTNYFSVQTPDQWTVHQYTVSFSPDTPSQNKVLANKLISFHYEVLGRQRVFDGRSLFLPIRLADEITVLPYKAKHCEGEIKIVYSARVEKGSGQILQIYNIIFRYNLWYMGLKLIGQNFFDPETRIVIEKHNLEVLEGVSTRVQPCASGMKLCVDPSYKIILLETMYDFMLRIYKLAANVEEFRHNCEIAVPGKIVITRYNNKTYTVQDIDFDGKPTDEFSYNGKTISYTAYMKEVHDVIVEDDQQPLLIAKSSKAKNSTIKIIPECCHLTGLPQDMKDDSHVMKDVSFHTKLKPHTRLKTMTNFISKMKTNERSKEALMGWQLSINDNPDVITAFQLSPENIFLGDGRAEPYRAGGEWLPFVRSNKLAVPVNLQNWLFVYPRQCDAQANALVTNIMSVCKPMNVIVNSPEMHALTRDHTRDYVTGLQLMLPQAGWQLVLCMLPRYLGDAYSAIKKVCNSEFSVPCQVVVRRTVNDPGKLRTIATKLAMLSLIKVGAELWHIKIPLQHMMVIGMDTHQAGPQVSAKRGSVNAFVATLNKNLSKYYSKTSYTHKYGEMSDALHVSMIGALNAYKQHNDGSLPRRIVIYRDGVGDGQLQSIKQYELPQFQRALDSLGAKCRPELVLIVVQKRVTARFLLPVDGADHQLVNPAPGTVVWDNVTRSDGDDFFMISHNAKVGTAGPVRYVILHNETTNLTKQRICELTYKLCHLNYNHAATCNIPAPCHYAHKLGAFVGATLQGREPHADLINTLYYL